MRPWKRWLFLVSGLTGVLVAVAVAAQAIRQGSWTPVFETGWLPAVVIASGSGSPRCWPRRRGCP